MDKKSEISLPLEEAFANEVYKGLNEWIEILFQYEKEIKYKVLSFVRMTVASCKVLSVSLPQLLASRKICAAWKSASLWELSCRYGTEM